MQFLQILHHAAISFFVEICEKIPRDVDELKAQITEAVATIDNVMLRCVWQELDYQLDVCRVTYSAHIEHSM